MATQRTGKETGGAPASTPAGGDRAREAASAIEDAQTAFEQAYPRFAASVVESNLDAERRASQALRDYMEAVSSAVEDARKRVDELLRDASNRAADAGQRQHEAKQNYAAALRPSAQEAGSVIDAQKTMAEAVQTAQIEAQARAEDAMRKHAAAQLNAQERASNALGDYSAALQKTPQDAAAMADAYRQYAARLEEIAKDTQKQSEEASGAYRSAQLDAQQRAAGAVRTYLTAVQASGPAPDRASDAARRFAATVTDAASTVAKADEDVMRRYAEAQAQVERRATEAQRAYAAALDQVRGEVQQRQVDAYRQYLVAVQRAWAQLNVDALVAGMTR
jgi:hypothetical protein